MTTSPLVRNLHHQIQRRLVQRHLNRKRMAELCRSAILELYGDCGTVDDTERWFTRLADGTSPPHVGDLDILAKAFGCTPAELLEPVKHMELPPTDKASILGFTTAIQRHLNDITELCGFIRNVIKDSSQTPVDKELNS